MNYSILAFVLFVLINPLALAQTWHIFGNDANDGKTPETAFRTLQKAADLVQPGDVVLEGSNVSRANISYKHLTATADRPIGIIPIFKLILNNIYVVLINYQS